MIKYCQNLSGRVGERTHCVTEVDGKREKEKEWLGGVRKMVRKRERECMRESVCMRERERERV